MVLNWWHSPEIISKLQIIVALLIICLTGFGLALKVQGDRLKKQIEEAQIRATQEKTSELQNELTTAKEKLDSSGQTIEQLTIETTQAKEKLNDLTADSIKVQKTIEELDIKAKKAARGISSVYDFQGAKRDTRPGVFNVTYGEESEIFTQIDRLEKEKKYPELLSVCKKQIAKTPEWLTPYLFLGLAQAKMGMKNEAILNFEYVIKNAPDEPAYQQAKEFIKTLKQ